MTENALTRLVVKLASVERVRGYRRRGDQGRTEKVNDYVRKHLDVAGFGGASLKKGAYVSPAGASPKAPEKPAGRGKRKPKGPLTPEARAKAQAVLDANDIATQNVVNAYRDSTPGEKVTGANWYPNANKIATIMASKYGVDVRTAAAMIATYSPQKAWGQNLIEANEALRTKKALGGGVEGLSYVRTPDDLQELEIGVMATQVQASRAADLLGGAEFQPLFAGGRNKNGSLPPKALKIRAFAELIANGKQPDPDNPQVVIDRHAAGIARGTRMTEDMYEVDGPSGSKKKFDAYSLAYTEAARELSKSEGRTITPEEVQAVTWLARQRLNIAEIPGREKLGQQDAENSLNYFASYDPDIADIMSDPMVGYVQLQDRLLAADAADRNVALTAIGLARADRLVDKVLAPNGKLVTWK